MWGANLDFDHEPLQLGVILDHPPLELRRCRALLSFRFIMSLFYLFFIYGVLFMVDGLELRGSCFVFRVSCFVFRVSRVGLGCR